MIRQALQQVLDGRSLSAAEAEGVMHGIMGGKATPAQIAGFLIALRMKGETVDEITGCARAMRRVVTRVEPGSGDLIDTCGTGGDGAGTFNISTTASFVVAGAGLRVAKHGNRSVSSKSGSADVLKALGVNLELTPGQVATCIDQVGIGFLFAPRLHPAMKHAIGPRRELGVRTIFNVLGPLTNPAGAQTQLLGVYNAALTEVLANVLKELGSRAAYVVHGHGGLDELSTTGPNRVSHFGVGGSPDEVVTETLDPTDLELTLASPENLKGGDPEDNAEITRAVLAGKADGPQRDIVLLNAGAALFVGGKTATLAVGISRAAEAIDDGSALDRLDALIALSRQLAPAG